MWVEAGPGWRGAFLQACSLEVCPWWWALVSGEGDLPVWLQKCRREKLPKEGEVSHEGGRRHRLGKGGPGRRLECTGKGVQFWEKAVGPSPGGPV